LKQFTDFIIKIGYIGGVCPAAIGYHFGRQCVLAPIRHIEQTLGMNILLGIRNGWHGQAR
jgi:hypothetical protein